MRGSQILAGRPFGVAVWLLTVPGAGVATCRRPPDDRSMLDRPVAVYTLVARSILAVDMTSLTRGRHGRC